MVFIGGWHVHCFYFVMFNGVGSINKWKPMPMTSPPVGGMEIIALGVYWFVGALGWTLLVVMCCWQFPEVLNRKTTGN